MALTATLWQMRNGGTEREVKGPRVVQLLRDGPGESLASSVTLG